MQKRYKSLDRISVVICCYNSNPKYLERVLHSLKSQSLPINFWELIIIDNNSDNPINLIVDIGWHHNAKICMEKNPGLVNARIRGVYEAAYEIIVTVDDDTPLYNNYLSNVIEIYNMNPRLGVIGGRTVPEYETQPPSWFKEFEGLLAIRDLGNDIIIEKCMSESELSYPKSAPLLIAPRKTCMLAYIEHYKKSHLSKQLGRNGFDLASGEDNDINLFIYKNGWHLGYFPKLKFIHLIPQERLTLKYLANMSFSSSVSWVKVLEIHKLNKHSRIAKWGILPREIKAWFKLKAWKNESNYIKWRGACGIFKGLSEIE
ncbi:MAG: glycosyltransferase family 2 protein [Flavobacterium sp.]|nr:MAG: glycosyltransferase family 2 protein [Flavobacterium sp.]